MIDLILEFFSKIPGSGFGNRDDGAERICVSDHLYATVSRAEITRVNKTFPLSTTDETPRDELHDCDDYALHLKAMLMAVWRKGNRKSASGSPPALGLLITETHALNIFVTSSGGKPKVMLCDVSNGKPIFAANASDATELMMHPPVVRWVYF
jgi:hypothetical protein